MRLGGNRKSLLKSADFTRSFASEIELDTIPTIEKEGSPFVKVASTWTTFASNPS
jgi:hypothetical protein